MKKNLYISVLCFLIVCSCVQKIKKTQNIFEAINAQQVDEVRNFLNQGTAIDTLDKYGETPLSLSVMNRASKIFRVLIQQGANINNVNKNGVTPLMYACALSRL